SLRLFDRSLIVSQMGLDRRHAFRKRGDLLAEACDLAVNFFEFDQSFQISIHKGRTESILTRGKSLPGLDLRAQVQLRSAKARHQIRFAWMLKFSVSSLLLLISSSMIFFSLPPPGSTVRPRERLPHCRYPCLLAF